MVSKVSVAITQIQEKSPYSRDFSAARWLEYFQQNREQRVAVTFPTAVIIAEELREPLIRSLQRFQIGETGEGKHLRSYAKTMNDVTYEQCIDLFIKEEQSHARLLAEMIAAADGTLLTWHWTDVVFILMRRMMGLKTEIFILLIAEIIGKCFYMLCARNLKNDRMSNAFSLIALDEIAHLQFQSAFLGTRLESSPKAVRHVIYYLWAMLFYSAVVVFILDHSKTLAGLNVSGRQFLGDCSKDFRRSASMALGITWP